MCDRRRSSRRTIRAATMDVDHGGDASPRIWSDGDVNANCPTHFVIFSEFPAPDCLHYNAVKYCLSYVAAARLQAVKTKGRPTLCPQNCRQVTMSAKAGL